MDEKKTGIEKTGIKKTAVIVINTKNHPEHRESAALLYKALEGRMRIDTVDMAGAGMLHEKYFTIRSCNPLFVITLDMAGFELRTENDTFSYNQIPCRMMHLLFGELQEYETLLTGKFNFSMFFYGRRQLCEKIRACYPEIENVEPFWGAGTALERFLQQGKIQI